MTDNEELKETTEEVSKEEQAIAWEDHVRQGLSDVLDKFLSVSEACNMGIRYGNPEIGTLEDGTVMFDTTKAVNVLINIVLKFEEPIDIPK
jgi:hypothetical protein